MDKYEYKVRAEEIKALIAKREFTEAVKIADTIDWSRVRSIMMLCTISDLYKINRRYKESKELLLLAYERHPGGRTIIYSLCELSIKMDEVVQAIEYYKEFVQIAPTDNGKFILQYKLYEAQDVSLEERIAVLEELKKRDYREKWAYELAYLYHRIGLSTKCVEECDELVLWFGEGKYVTKAMELKMLHKQLTPVQQEKYNVVAKVEEMHEKASQYAEEKESQTNNSKQSAPEMDIQVKTMDVGQYNTINLQKELAKSMREILKPTHEDRRERMEQPVSAIEPEVSSAQLKKETTPDAQEIFFEDEKEKTAPQPSIKEIMEQELVSFSNQEVNQLPSEETVQAPEMKQEIFEMDTDEDFESDEDTEEDRVVSTEVSSSQKIQDEHSYGQIISILPKHSDVVEMKNPAFDISKATLPAAMEQLLAQDYDGQITLVVPESEKIEKQITGQMSIEDILAEWEKTKKENEQKRMQDVRQRVLQHTGALFTEFDVSVRDGILEQLQKEAEAAEESHVTEVQFADVTEAGEALFPEEEQQNADEHYEIQDVTEEEETPETVEDDELEEADSEEIDSEEIDVEEADSEEEDSGEDLDDSEDDLEDDSEEDSEGPVNKDARIRNLTDDEKILFASFIQTRTDRMRLVKALDSLSLVAPTGNLIITGETAAGTINLAKNIIKQMQNRQSKFSGKIARVTGESLNNKNIAVTVAKLVNGALIIEKAGGMQPGTVVNLLAALEKSKTGILVILEDTKKAIQKIAKQNAAITTVFNAYIEIEELNNDALVSYGRQYAEHMEFAIDEMGVLALHTRIEDLQTSDHIVTVLEVREIVDRAIHHASRKNLTHFFDILFARRYDDQDMIILREKDFVC